VGALKRVFFMAKTSQIARNIKRIRMSERMNAKRLALKKEGNWEALQKLPKNASPVRVKNRCSVTGRSRGYMRYFGISRQQFREMARRGEIPGVKKSSW
jgi:small subunit ribosomal protein S14